MFSPGAEVADRERKQRLVGGRVRQVEDTGVESPYASAEALVPALGRRLQLAR